MARIINLQSDNYFPTKDNIASIDIKFGNKVYSIATTNIAYIYKSEGVFFIVDKTNLKLPIGLQFLSQLPIDLEESLYFQIDDETIFCKENFAIVKPTHNCIEVISKNTFKDKFQIPEHLINQFQTWFES